MKTAKWGILSELEESPFALGIIRYSALYLLTILEQCSEEKFGQDAVEHALVTGALKLTYNLATDLHTIFDQRSNCCDAPPQNGCASGRDAGTGRCRQCGEVAVFETNYDRFVEANQKHCQAEVRCQEHDDALVEIYCTAGLLEEILRPMSLAQRIPEPAHEHVET